jgi:glycosyltransferase involved in cell wall biosynthesis
MQRETLTEQKDELSLRKASENELARFVLDEAGAPVDRLAVAVILETCGIRDVDAVKKYGRKDVFDLADKIYDRCRTILADVPELTVSMSAYNKEKLIGGAIESILLQDGVDFELIVVDDGSEDNTVDSVQSFKDPRIKLIRNKSHRGFAYCHNLAIERSISPFIAYVGADGVVLPGAFQKMIGELKSSPNIGQVLCYDFHVDENTRITRDSFRKEKNLFPKNIKPGLDDKKGLLVHGSVTKHLRIYRREVLILVGKFDETVEYGLDYDIALRIAYKYNMKLIREFLYCKRVNEGSTTKLLNIKAIGSWFQRLVFCFLLSKNKEINFLRQKEYDVSKLMIAGLYYALRITNMFYFVIEAIKNPEKFRRVITSLKIWI